MRWIYSFAFCVLIGSELFMCQALENLEDKVTTTIETVRKRGKEKLTRSDGQICVINNDCTSKCCIYANSVSGRCVPKAPIGHVCGIVLGAASSVEEHYRLCESCDSSCCCGESCCPSSFCVSALQMQPKVCTKCATGCCCNDETCCPLPYCAISPGLVVDLKGEACQRCPSGCCCDDSCCFSSFCKGSIGQFCSTCASGCCCGALCCAASFCDSSDLTYTKLLALYAGMGALPRYSPLNAASLLAFPVPVDASRALGDSGPGSSYLPDLFGNTDENQQRTMAIRCVGCTTGCCCDFGCCNIRYCM